MKFNANILREGYFIVYKKREGFHPLEKLIEKEQKNEGFNEEDAEYIHVEGCIGDNTTINHAFPFARRIKIDKKRKGRYVKIVTYKHYKKESPYKVAINIASLNNTIYGLWSLFWFKVNSNEKKSNNILASRHTPFCSFGSAWSVKKVHNESFENSSTVMPADFLNKDKFNVIWEGIIE